MPDRIHPPAPSRREEDGGSLPNESRLRALGEAVDRRNGTPHKSKKVRSRRRGRRIVGWTAVGLVAVIIAVAGGAYWFANHELNKLHRQHINSLAPTISGKPFNLLIIGSDSRVGLKGKAAKQAGAGSVSGQRSDAIKILHIDPAKHTIAMVSIPRDTLVTLLANQDLYTKYNRINVNYGAGPALLVRTIEANFGIPISHVVQVSFEGLINAADVLGGVWLNFKYKARDRSSGLHIRKKGCQLLTGAETLAFVRSRHYEYLVGNQWIYDPTSDYGRIQRQDTFIRALIDAAKGKYNPFTIDHFVSALSNGIILDSGMTNNFLLGLAYDFKDFNSSKMKSYTLPTVSDGYVAPYGDVLSEQEPYAQKLLVKVFGSSLIPVKDPPPNGNLQPITIPDITPTTTTTVHTSGSGGHATTTKHKTTTPTTLVPPDYDPWNPVPCGPGT